MKKNNILYLLAFSSLLFSCGEANSSPISEPSNNISSEISSEEIISSEVISSEEISSIPPEIVFEKKVDMTYEFVGDEKDKPGFAQGIISITPTTSKKKSGNYFVFFANDYGVLDNYDELACIPITGEKVTYEVKDSLYIPSEASKLAVFEYSRYYYIENPDITKAVDIIDIPKEKILKLDEPSLTFGVTSDVHMNYEDLGFGSHGKWERALEFFAENNSEYVLVTGDMTGDTNLEYEYLYYISCIDESRIPMDNVFESIGNHGNTKSNIKLFNQYTSGKYDIHPYENSPYYHVLIEGKNEARDNMFIFMAQEINGPSDSAAYDNFSKEQIDWLEGLLNQYSNTDTNIFLTIHSPFLNYGPGDRHNGDYTRMITFKDSYTQTMRLKGLIETHKDIIIMSGHTHLTYYEGENYSDEYGSSCRMVHVSSGTQTSSYNHGTTLISDTDGRLPNSPDYGSEGYIVNVYDDYIKYTGYNISTNKIIPAACILIPTHAYGGNYGYKEPEVNPDDNVEIYELLKGNGTLEDPYQISSEYEFKIFTKQFEDSITKTESDMFGYGKYFIQTKDLDMSDVDDYYGTYAAGDLRYTFAGNYNGNGHSIKVNINGKGQVSVFPYTYGVISNLKVEGQIKGTTCAQVVRALHGQLINCIIDVNLIADQVGGIIYSNYGYLYNVYTTGKLNASKIDPISIGHSSTKYHNVFHYRVNSANKVVSSSYGTQSNDLSLIASTFNDTTNSQYNNAINYLNGVKMLEVEVIDGKLVFKK